MRYEGFGSKFPLGGDKSEDKRVEILVTYVKKVKKKYYDTFFTRRSFLYVGFRLLNTPCLFL